MSTPNDATLLRRLAPMAVTVALLGAACELAPPSGLDAGTDPIGSAAAPTVRVAPTLPDPPIADDDRAVTTETTESSENTGTGGATEPNPSEPTPTSGVEERPAAGGEDEPAPEPGQDPSPSPFEDLVIGRMADGRIAVDASVIDEPVNLVYVGRGTHVADLLVEVGPVAPGSSLTVDYGDGTVADVGPVSTGQQVTLSHAFEPTLTFDTQVVWATVTEPDGTEHRDRLTFDTRARFDLFYSPIRVTALNDCDTFGKGDFHLTWDHGDGAGSASFALGAGESARIGGFAGPGGRIVYDQEVPFDLSLSEEDPWGAWLFAPWKWDGFKFRGGSHYSFRPIRQVGDHTYTITNSSSSDEGVDGDDDCATLVAFDVTLDMLDG